jgi:hypothetical protein
MNEEELFEEWLARQEWTPTDLIRSVALRAWQARAALATTEATDAIAPTERTYTTQPGESVAGIALRQCGNEAEWRHILACNPQFADMLPHEYFPVGTVLTMPAPSPEAPAVDALEEGKKIMEKLWADPNGPFLKGQWEAPIAQPAVDALTTGAVAYDMAYANGNRGLLYPEELAHIEKARIVTGYVATPLYFAHPASEPETLTEAQRMNLLLHADDLDFMGRGDEAKALRNILAHPAPSPKSLTDEHRKAVKDAALLLTIFIGHDSRANLMYHFDKDWHERTKAVAKTLRALLADRGS